MEYTCIYEATKNEFVTTPLIILSILEVAVLIYSIFNWRYNRISGKIGMCIVNIILIIIIVSIVISSFSTNKIWSEYKNNDYVVVEGKIENYECGTNEKLAFPDRFTVQDIDFIVSQEPYYGYGYTQRQAYGGLLKNDILCKIYYIPYGNENVIMKILILDASYVTQD